MPITLIDIAKPKNGQPFPIVEDSDFLGGFRVVSTDVDRNAIGVKLKKHGMWVFVVTTGIVWWWNNTTSTWIEAVDLGNLSPQPSQSYDTFTAAAPSTSTPGDLVRPVAGTGTTVDFADVHLASKLPVVGCIISKPDPITAVVQTSGMVVGVYSNLVPGQRYLVGRTSRPALPSALVPSSGEALFHQHVGLAIDMSTLMLTPNFNLTRTIGA